MSAGRVRVLVYHTASDAAEVEAAYHRVSQELFDVPGLLGNELLKSRHDPAGFVVVSSWRDMEAFQAWEQGPLHHDQTAPLRPFRDTRMNPPFGVYEVVDHY